MKNIRVFALLMSISSSLFANVNMDKGILNVSFKDVEMISANYTLPSNCSNQKIKLTTKNNTVKVVHVNNECSNGATVKVIIPKKMQSNIVLENGVIQANEQELIENFSKISLNVNAGVINSSKLTSKRTSNYAGAIVKENTSSKGPSVNINLTNGVINLK